MELQNAAERFNHSAHVRLDEMEDRAFQQVVDELGTTRSKLLKKIIRELIGAGPDLLAQEWKLMEDLRFQLAAIGRNFNQLVRAIHTGKMIVTPQDRALVEGVRDQVEQVRKEIVIIIDRSCHRWVKGASQ
jgi:Zn-dependent oligopeptidase